jgi:nucleoside-diphosphate-sugar epimerase
MAKILVTGGAGFTGSYVVEAFFEKVLEKSVTYFSARERSV